MRDDGCVNFVKTFFNRDQPKAKGGTIHDSGFSHKHDDNKDIVIVKIETFWNKEGIKWSNVLGKQKTFEKVSVRIEVEFEG